MSRSFKEYSSLIKTIVDNNDSFHTRDDPFRWRVCIRDKGIGLKWDYFDIIDKSQDYFTITYKIHKDIKSEFLIAKYPDGTIIDTYVISDNPSGFEMSFYSAIAQAIKDVMTAARITY